jgi:hypothetical protein
MDEKMIEQLQENEEDVVEKQKPILCCGLDIGTMNIVLSRSDKSEVQITRNVFLPVKEDEISISDLSDINYIKSESGNIYIIGEDAFRFANIFSKEVSRPMEKGLISPKEVNAIDVLTMIVRNIIGKTKKQDAYCSYSIPSQAIDEGRSVIYHERVFGKILGSLGINHSPVNEAAAIIFSECSKEKFSGIGISFGAGMCNIALMYKGIEAGKFSTSRSGDYIDRSVAESLSIIPNRVTSIKERFLDLTINPYDDKKNGRMIEALQFYYDSMINYTIKKMVEEFNKNIDIDIEEPLPIIVSGGTSLPNGFIELFKTVFSKYSFPIKISEIRRASNPMTAVSRGLLIKTMSDIKK